MVLHIILQLQGSNETEYCGFQFCLILEMMIMWEGFPIKLVKKNKIFTGYCVMYKIRQPSLQPSCLKGNFPNKFSAWAECLAPLKIGAVLQYWGKWPMGPNMHKILGL